MSSINITENIYLHNEKFWNVVRKKFFAKNWALLVVVKFPLLAT